MSEAVVSGYFAVALLTWMIASVVTQDTGKGLGYALVWPLTALFGIAISLRLAVRHAIRTWREL